MIHIQKLCWLNIWLSSNTVMIFCCSCVWKSLIKLWFFVVVAKPHFPNFHGAYRPVCFIRKKRTHVNYSLCSLPLQDSILVVCLGGLKLCFFVSYAFLSQTTHFLNLSEQSNFHAGGVLQLFLPFLHNN